MVILNNSLILEKMEKREKFKDGYYQKLYSLVEPIIYICRIMGLLPIFNVKKGNKTIIQISDHDWMCFTVYIVTYLLMLLYNMKVVIYEEIFLYADKLLQIIFIFMTGFYTVTLIIFGYRKRDIINDSLDAIAEVDNFLKLANLEIDYEGMKKKITKNLMIIFTLTSTRILFFILISEITFMQQMLLITIPTLKLGFVFIFSVIIDFLSSRFDLINSTLKSYGDEHIDSHNVSIFTERLYILCRSHFKLCNVGQKISESFGFQLLVTSIIMILNFLGQSYFLYALCTQDVKTGHFIKPCAILFWFATELLELCGLLIVCTEACDNANEIPITLHEVQNKVENSEFEDHLQLFSLQMIHHKLAFSALGFFEFDFTLLYAMMGTVLTFLVIVVQYEQGQIEDTNFVTKYLNLSTTISSDIVEGDYYDDDDDFYQ